MSPCRPPPCRAPRSASRCAATAPRAAAMRTTTSRCCWASTACWSSRSKAAAGASGPATAGWSRRATGMISRRATAAAAWCSITHPLWAQFAGRPPSAAPQALSLAHYLAQCLAAATHGADAGAAARPGPAAGSLGAAGRGRRSRRRRIDWAALADWAQARWRAPLGVAELASVVCLSPSQFAQRCRDEQGTSPMGWLRASACRMRGSCAWPAWAWRRPRGAPATARLRR